MPVIIGFNRTSPLIVQATDSELLFIATVSWQRLFAQHIERYVQHPISAYSSFRIQTSKTCLVSHETLVRKITSNVLKFLVRFTNWDVDCVVATLHFLWSVTSESQQRLNITHIFWIAGEISNNSMQFVAEFYRAFGRTSFCVPTGMYIGERLRCAVREHRLRSRDSEADDWVASWICTSSYRARSSGREARLQRHLSFRHFWICSACLSLQRQC